MRIRRQKSLGLRSGRILAAAIGLTSLLALGWTFYDYSYGLDALRFGLTETTLYYTHWVTALTAFVFFGAVWRWRDFTDARIIGHIVVSLGILVLHYWYFRGLDDYLVSPLRSKIVHGLLPAAVVIFWFFWARIETLTWKSPFAWTAFALIYTGYALVRGAVFGDYAYDVGNVSDLGYKRVLLLVAATILFAIGLGYAFVVVAKLQLAIRRKLDRKRAAPR